MGRQVAIVEFGPTWSSSGSVTGDVSGGTARLWIDPERMFAMREITDGGEHGSYSVELISLQYGLPKSEVDTSFAVPKGAQTVDSSDQNSALFGGVAGTSNSGVTVSGTPDQVIHTPGGFFRPSYVPTSYYVVGETVSSTSTNEVVGAETLFRLNGTGAYLHIEQRLRVDGLPTGLVTADMTTVNGHDAYRGTNGTAKTLAWYQDGVAVLLSSDALSYEELQSVADSMTLY